MMTTSDLTHFQNSRNAFVPHEAEWPTFLFQIDDLNFQSSLQ